RKLLRLGDQLGLRGLVTALRGSLAAARPFAEARFEDDRTRAWFAGHAAHSMLPLERRPSAGFGLALIVLGHAFGWPFPRGGAQRLADALAGRLQELGGELKTSSLVEELPRADLVLADVVPRELGRLARGRLPGRDAQPRARYRSSNDMTERIEAQVERFAPGFRGLILARSSMGPTDLEAHNRNLVGGDLNAGVMDLGQLLFRPVPKLVPYRTPLEGVYLCS